MELKYVSGIYLLGNSKGASRSDIISCYSGGVEELYYVHPVQSWWSIAILALAVGKRNGLFVRVRYIYLRKKCRAMVES